MSENNDGQFTLHGSNGIYKTKLHGAEQQLYIVAGETLETLNTYSDDFQIFLTMSSIALGSFLSSLPTYNSNRISQTLMWVSLVVLILATFLLSRSWKKISSIKKKLFVEYDVEERFRIIEAHYGLLTDKIDVTEKLNTLISNDSLSFVGDNATAGGDPLPGTGKKWIIKYINNGSINQKEFNENSTINLP